jgi:hypothetical protein
LLIGASVVLVLWWVVLGVFRSQELGTIGTIIALLYVLGDVVVVTTMQSSREIGDPERHDLRLFSAAFVVLAFADAAFAYQLANGTYRDGRLPSLGWLVAWAAVCWAAVLARRPGSHEHRRRIRDVYLYGSIAVGVAATITSLVVNHRLAAIQGWCIVALAVIGVAARGVPARDRRAARTTGGTGGRVVPFGGALPAGVRRHRGRHRRRGSVARLTAVNSTLPRMLEAAAETSSAPSPPTSSASGRSTSSWTRQHPGGGELHLAATTLPADSGVNIPVRRPYSNLRTIPLSGRLRGDRARTLTAPSATNAS